MFSKFKNILQENMKDILNEKDDELNENENIILYDEFKNPIQYLEKDKYKLNNIVLSDLELQNKKIEEDISYNNIDLSNNNTDTMYDHLVMPEHIFAKNVINNANKYYTTNVSYLKDTQEVIKNIPKFENNLTGSPINCEEFLDIWEEVKNNGYFLEKYCYIDWDMFKSVNKSSAFLQLLSLMNMFGPLLSFILPVLFLLLPFIILKFQGIPITFDAYIKLLKEIAKHHFIGKLLNFKNLSPSSVFYLLISVGLYGVQIYQNINICIRFYKNITNVNNYLCNMRNYLQHTISSMESFYNVNKELVNYESFCNDVMKSCEKLKEFYNSLSSIQPFKPNIAKIVEIGYLLKQFYILHSDKTYEKSIKYSVGFNGYINNIKNIYYNIEKKHISFAIFNKNDKTCLKNQYYPPFYNEKHIKNDCLLNKNIVTGPNASGKTTYLKTTALNIIFTQQYGVGFYSYCSLNPYQHIHSYLNIPDTSGRDSLFQAESRRCKDILNTINANVDERHFTIFDELFSGTNPTEATKSAFAFLLYLSKYDNVDYILTTHYTKICKKLEKSGKVENYKMIVSNKNNKIKYTYKIKKGISRIQGATSILEEMNYPGEIIDTIKNY